MDSDLKCNLLAGYLKIHILCQEPQALGCQQCTRCMFHTKPKVTSVKFIASVFQILPKSVQRTIKLASLGRKRLVCTTPKRIFQAKDSKHI